MTVPIPDDSARRRRIALLVAASVVGVLVVAVSAWALMHERTAGPSSPSYTPAEETTASSPATSSGVASAPAGEGATETAASGQSTTTAAGGRAKIAFRLGRSLYVANEDGSGAVAMKRADPVYALAPDGSALALVRSGKLVIESVGDGRTTVVGSAELVTPVWTADSSAALFVRAGDQGVPQVWRVRKDGSGAVSVGPGQGAAVSPDGTTLALLATEADSDSPAVTVIRPGGRSSKVKVPNGNPVAVALSRGALYVSTLSPTGVAAIWVSAIDGSGRRELIGAMPADGKAAIYGRLLLSPDSRSLAYTADGDDGYSRIWVVSASGGSPRQVTARRDGYPLAWTSDGRGLLFFEGNSFQGESSALWRAEPDGSHRRMLVSGAIQ